MPRCSGGRAPLCPEHVLPIATCGKVGGTASTSGDGRLACSAPASSPVFRLSSCARSNSPDEADRTRWRSTTFAALADATPTRRLKNSALPWRVGAP
jgi:hypothetical protein